MGYHEYQNTWIPIVGEVLQCRMEPDNNVDKYAVAVMNKYRVVGHLIKGKNRKFAKSVFFFLRVDVTNSSKNKWEGCEQRKRNGNGSSMYNNIQWYLANVEQTKRSFANCKM